MKKDTKVRGYHAHAWNEPLVQELGNNGERGVLIPKVEDDIKRKVGDPKEYIPENIRRRQPPNLPELSQPHVLRHYLRLSQETLGMAVNIDFGMGTCTMKYSPIVNERLVNFHKFSNLHPLQDEDTVQGVLEIIHEFAGFMKEISGMDEFSFQPGGGAHGIYANACMIRKYHEARGELAQRTEVITTLFSHPSDAACPATAGFKIITLQPDPKTGLPDIEALKASVSERTAGLMITNPEDTGIFNPNIDKFVDIVHGVGGLCAYDQANSNALFGLTRAREAGFDLCHFNLHKAFSTPHSSMGPACGAVGVRKELEKFLPVPVVTYDGKVYHLDYDREHTIGKIKQFLGNVAMVVRAYAWVMSLGVEGLRKVAETSIINTNYLIHKMLEIPSVALAYPSHKWRLDQARFSLEKIKKDTGVGTEDMASRIVDYGVQEYFTSHHPWVVPEPLSPEPSETFSKDDIDYWVSIFRRVSEEAYSDAQLVKGAPHNQAIGKIDARSADDPDRWAMTWRAYLRKNVGNT